MLSHDHPAMVEARNAMRRSERAQARLQRARDATLECLDFGNEANWLRYEERREDEAEAAVEAREALWAMGDAGARLSEAGKVADREDWRRLGRTLWPFRRRG